MQSSQSNLATTRCPMKTGKSKVNVFKHEWSVAQSYAVNSLNRVAASFLLKFLKAAIEAKWLARGRVFPFSHL